MVLIFWGSQTPELSPCSPRAPRCFSARRSRHGGSCRQAAPPWGLGLLQPCLGQSLQLSSDQPLTEVTEKLRQGRSGPHRASGKSGWGQAAASGLGWPGQVVSTPAQAGCQESRA